MNILIIGGGISGISAAKVALALGHSVTICEVENEIGGLMSRIANCRIGFKTFYDEIKEHSKLTVIKGVQIKKVEKDEKVYTVKFDNEGEVLADKVIIATGLTPYDPVEYKGKRILTSLEYDALIDQRQSELPHDFNRIAFFLCVGSRSKEYPLCSSVCCSYTLREIKWTLQRAKPHIAVFYNDLRFFGQEFFMEKVFRDAGVKFIRANSRYFEEDEDGVTVRYFEEGGIKTERFNYVVLAIGLRPHPTLKRLSEIFGFSLNEYGFIKEVAPLTTDVDGIYVCGGALEPLNIKDSILTGFGAGFIASNGYDKLEMSQKYHEFIYREEFPHFEISREHERYVFYIGTDNPRNAYFYEYVSSEFINLSIELKLAGKDIYVVTKNLVMPSYSEITYEKARKEGVVFIHLEENETVSYFDGNFKIYGGAREFSIDGAKIILMDEMVEHLSDKLFLTLYRSEPQLRWSPTKWDRKRYHTGFIRHPREDRWVYREIFGAYGEITLDFYKERQLPKVDEDRCSGCASCKNACPYGAIEIEFKEKALAIFGQHPVSYMPVAHVREESCAGCGLCISTCPSDSIQF